MKFFKIFKRTEPKKKTREAVEAMNEARAQKHRLKKKLEKAKHERDMLKYDVEIAEYQKELAEHRADIAEIKRESASHEDDDNVNEGEDSNADWVAPVGHGIQSLIEYFTGDKDDEPKRTNKRSKGEHIADISSINTTGKESRDSESEARRVAEIAKGA